MYIMCYISIVTVSIIRMSFAETNTANFIQMRKCPTANVKSFNLNTKMECAKFCSDQPHCDAFNFDASTGSCYLGDACSTLPQWTSGACRSFDYADASESDTSSVSNPLFRQLKMKLFYKFKTSGLVNEVNPRHFCLTAHDVKVGRNGAEFKGIPTSYLSTETPGFEQFLDYGSTYSAFVQARHVIDPSRYQAYFRVQQCSAEQSSASLFQYAQYIYSYADFSNTVPFYPESFSSNFLTADRKPALLSVGYAFNKTTHKHFYFNQTLVGIASVTNRGSSTTGTSNFQCLTLGHYASSSWSLNGTMNCFGLSTALLGVEDFKKLEAYCSYQ